ncbi:hypothetical protein FB451DRAFT_1413781 [Mycena latifolia]|nr:hypothetical protein FB451DRAFT_1413781 [Mycena latifolia]
MENVHPDIIDRYYGVEGDERVPRPGQTGAGHPDDEEDSDAWEDEHDEDFLTHAMEANFFAALAEITEQNIVPQGFGVQEDEWEDGGYPAAEAINPGTRGKEIIVALPREIWLPRAIFFAQALDAMTRFLVFQEEEGDRGDRGDDSASSSQEDID